MPYKKTERAPIRWITVPLDDALHGEVRARSVKLHQSWPAVVAEAMHLWLAHDIRETR